jgi:hypothetical protein
MAALEGVDVEEVAGACPFEPAADVASMLIVSATEASDRTFEV